MVEMCVPLEAKIEPHLVLCAGSKLLELGVQR